MFVSDFCFLIFFQHRELDSFPQGSLVHGTLVLPCSFVAPLSTLDNLPQLLYLLLLEFARPSPTHSGNKQVAHFFFIFQGVCACVCVCIRTVCYVEESALLNLVLLYQGHHHLLLRRQIIFTTVECCPTTRFYDAKVSACTCLRHLLQARECINRYSRICTSCQNVILQTKGRPASSSAVLAKLVLTMNGQWIERIKTEKGIYLRPLMTQRSYAMMQPIWNTALQQHFNMTPAKVRTLFRIGTSSRHGLGVFARCAFAAKQYLPLIHRGVWQMHHNQDQLPANRYPNKISYLFELPAIRDNCGAPFAVLNPMDKDGDLIADEDNFASRINSPSLERKETPNVKFVHIRERPPWEVYVQTLCAIKPDEELLTTYGPAYSPVPVIDTPSSSSSSSSSVSTTSTSTESKSLQQIKENSGTRKPKQRPPSLLRTGLEQSSDSSSSLSESSSSEEELSPC